MASEWQDTALSSDFEELRVLLQEKFGTQTNKSEIILEESVIVHSPVKNSSNVDWVDRIREEENNYYSEHVSFIPYYSEKTKWIGIILQFESENYLRRIGYIHLDQLRTEAVLNEETSQETCFTIQCPHKAPSTSSRLKYEQCSILIEAIIDILRKEDDKITTHNCKICEISEGIKSDGHRGEIGMRIDSIQDYGHSLRQYNTAETIKGCACNPISNILTTKDIKYQATLYTPRKELYPSEIKNRIDEHAVLQQDIPSQFMEFEVEHEYELEAFINEIGTKLRTAENFGKKKTVSKWMEEFQTLKNSQSLLNEQNDLAESSKNVLQLLQRPIICDKQGFYENADYKRLLDLYKDFTVLPDCSDKHLLALMFLTSKKLYAREKCEFTVCFHNFEEELGSAIQRLDDRFKIEKIKSSTVKDSWNLCQICLKSNHWDLALIELRKIWKNTRFICIEELERLVMKVNETAVRVKDKDIILLLGSTGVGKSTTVHFLAGSEMIQTEVNGMIHIAPVKIKSHDLKPVVTSPSSSSITQYMYPINIRLSDVEDHGEIYATVCDSPGFNDTRGTEIDIANVIGMMKTMKTCRSVKPVVLISYKSIGDRYTGLKELIRNLAGIIRNASDTMESFEYVFTKFPTEERDQIHATLLNMKKHLSESEVHDTSFMIILDDMISKTEKSVKSIDLIKDDPRILLDGLIKSSYIMNPCEIFQPSAFENSKRKLERQAEENKINIISGIERFDYPYIQYKLDQLEYLRNLFECNSIKHIYETSIDAIRKHLVGQYHVATESFRSCLINQDILTKDNILKYQSFIKQATDAEDLQRTHFTEEIVDSDAYTQFLYELIETMGNDVRSRDIDDVRVKLFLDKLKLLMGFFIDTEKIYRNFVEIFEKKLEKNDELFQSSLYGNKFEETDIEMTKMRKAISIFNGHITDLEKTYENQKLCLVSYLQKITEKFSHSFGKTLDKSDIDDINRCYEILEFAEKNVPLHAHISRNSISTIHRKLSNNIVDYLNAKIENIDVFIVEKKEFIVLEGLMSEIDDIRTINCLEIQNTQSYFMTIEKIIEYLIECHQNCEKLLINFFTEESTDFTILSNSLMRLQHAKWVEKYRKNSYENVISSIQKYLMNQLESYENYIKHFNFSLHHISEMEINRKMIKRIDQIDLFSKILPDIHEKTTSLKTIMVKTSHKIFVVINETFDAENFKNREHYTIDPCQAENSLKYVLSCKEIPMLNDADCKSTLDELEKFIRDYSVFIKNELEETFEKIETYTNSHEHDLSSDVRTLSNRLQEYTNVANEYKLIFSHFIDKGLVSYWSTRIHEYRSQLEEDMAICSHNFRLGEFYTNLSVVKALSKLDIIIDNLHFKDLHKQYQNVFFADVDKICERAIEAIKYHDYQLAGSEILILNTGNGINECSVKRICRKLDTSIKSLKEKTYNVTVLLERSMKKEDIIIIVDNLDLLEKAKQFVSDFLDDSADIDKFREEVKSLIETKMNTVIEIAKASLETNNFFQFEQILDSLVLLRQILRKYCTKTVANHIDELAKRRDVFFSEKLVETYSTMDIEKYMIHPPIYLFTRLAEVSDINPIYQNASKTIKEIIIKKMRNALKEANEKKPLSDKNEQLTQIGFVLKCLPDEVKAIIEYELEFCKNEVLT